MHSINHIPFFKKYLKPQVHITTYPETSVQTPVVCHGNTISRQPGHVTNLTQAHSDSMLFTPTVWFVPGNGEANAFPFSTAASLQS